MSEYESRVQMESALSVAHDLVDTIVNLKTEIKFLAENQSKFTSIVTERDNQIQALIDECSRRDDTITGLGHQITSLTNEIGNLKSERLVQGKDHDKLLSDRESFLSTIRELKGIISTQDGEIVKLNDYLGRAKKAVNDQAESFLSLETTNEAQRQELVRRENEITALKIQIEILSRTNETLREEITDYVKALESTKMLFPANIDTNTNKKTAKKK